MVSTHNLGTHTLADTVRSPVYLGVLHGLGTKLPTFAFAFGSPERYARISSSRVQGVSELMLHKGSVWCIHCLIQNTVGVKNTVSADVIEIQ